MIGTLLGAVGGLLLIWVIDRYDLIELPGEVAGDGERRHGVVAGDHRNFNA